MNSLAANLLSDEDFPEKNLPTTHALMGKGGKTGDSGGGCKLKRKATIYYTAKLFIFLNFIVVI